MTQTSVNHLATPSDDYNRPAAVTGDAGHNQGLSGV